MITFRVFNLGDYYETNHIDIMDSLFKRLFHARS